MATIAVLGAGHIGQMAACLLAGDAGHDVHLIDITINDAKSLKTLQKSFPQCALHEMDLTKATLLKKFIKTHHVEAVICCLPYFMTSDVAKVARETDIHFFALTEDVGVTEEIKTLAKGAKKAFVPQCGLAPGYINVLAYHLAKEFDELDEIRLRTGALPVSVNNKLRYSLTWSIDGLLNQYAKPCPAIKKGKLVKLEPLRDLEEITIEGVPYEAFNTSGGIGTMMSKFKGKVKNLNYKSLRYPGHCEYMRFLMQELKLSEHLDVLKKILLNALPQVIDDQIIVYVSVVGRINGALKEESVYKYFYPKEIHGISWSAIQIVTAAEVCAALELVLHGKYKGFLDNTAFELDEIRKTTFGQYL